MNNPACEWDPGAPAVRSDQIAAYDALRERCPVAHSSALGWSPTRHGDVLAALQQPETFSSRVSAHVAVPNGMDGAEHASYRAVVDCAFTAARVEQFAQPLRRIAEDLIADFLTAGSPGEVMTTLAEPFAARSLCSYVGWQTDVASDLRRWAAQSEVATRARDRAELERVAAEFDAIITVQLHQARRHQLAHHRPAEEPAAESAHAATADGPGSITELLLEQRVHGRALTDAEIVAIMRNWTAGELGTIAAAVGILLATLAAQPALADHLRGTPGGRRAAVDEILRLEPPLIANRRITTRKVEMSGVTIPADAPVSILWPAVQRDPRAFPAPQEFRADRDPSANLLYGRGPHYCPGEGLARLQLETVLDVVLRELPPFTLAAPPIRASYPAGGFTEVRLDWTQARAKGSA